MRRSPFWAICLRTNASRPGLWPSCHEVESRGVFVERRADGAIFVWLLGHLRRPRGAGGLGLLTLYGFHSAIGSGCAPESVTFSPMYAWVVSPESSQLEGGAEVVDAGAQLDRRGF